MVVEENGEGMIILVVIEEGEKVEEKRTMQLETEAPVIAEALTEEPPPIVRECPKPLTTPPPLSLIQKHP